VDGLKRTEIKIKGNMFSGVKKQGKYMSTSEVIKSWDNGTIEVIAEDINGIGLRPAQFGALSAIRAHWTVSNKDATVVMPTGERVIIVMGALNALESKVSGTLNRYISRIT